MRWLYRVRQFWSALTAAPRPEDLFEVGKTLSPALMRLFEQMHPSEQAHSLIIYRRLREQGETDTDLLAAALLHDVGKSLYPLQMGERVAIVLMKALFPGYAKSWGQGEPKGWKRPFVIAEKHAEWGAQMAAQAGASPTTVELIRRHQEPALSDAHPRLASRREDHWLMRLQSLDNES